MIGVSLHAAEFPLDVVARLIRTAVAAVVDLRLGDPPFAEAMPGVELAVEVAVES